MSESVKQCLFILEIVKSLCPDGDTHSFDNLKARLETKEIGSLKEFADEVRNIINSMKLSNLKVNELTNKFD